MRRVRSRATPIGRRLIRLPIRGIAFPARSGPPARASTRKPIGRSSVSNALLGGAQVQLSAYDKLSSSGILGNVRAPGGGFKDSALGGSQIKTKSNLDVMPGNLGMTAPPQP